MAQLAKGDIPTLILAVLAERGPRHSYAIARQVESENESFRLREGSLYPALRGLEQDGFISGEWEIPASGQSGPPRKIYTITDAGRGELAKRREGWRRYVNAISAMLDRGEVSSFLAAAGGAGCVSAFMGRAGSAVGRSRGESLPPDGWSLHKPIEEYHAGMQECLTRLGAWLAPLPDRDRELAEIGQHLDERVRYLADCIYGPGIEEEEAVSQAVEEFGSAEEREEIGKELLLAGLERAEFSPGDFWSAAAWGVPSALAAALLSGVLSASDSAPSWWAAGLILFPTMSGLMAGVFSPKWCRSATFLSVLLAGYFVPALLLHQSVSGQMLLGSSCCGWVAAALSRKFARRRAVGSMLVSFPEGIGQG